MPLDFIPAQCTLENTGEMEWMVIFNANMILVQEKENKKFLLHCVPQQIEEQINF